MSNALLWPAFRISLRRIILSKKSTNFEDSITLVVLVLAALKVQKLLLPAVGFIWTKLWVFFERRTGKHFGKKHALNYRIGLRNLCVTHAIFRNHHFGRRVILGRILVNVMVHISPVPRGSRNVSRCCRNLRFQKIHLFPKMHPISSFQSSWIAETSSRLPSLWIQNFLRNWDSVLHVNSVNGCISWVPETGLPLMAFSVHGGFSSIISQ